MPPIILHNPADFPQSLHNTVLSVGNFDGVHAGHAQMLTTARTQATQQNKPFTIMTFDPHPAALLRPTTPRIPLTTTQQRLALLSQFNPDAIILIPTTKEFLAITAPDFLRKILHDNLRATLLVEGPTFTYGQGAKGTMHTLQQEGPQYNIQTLLVPTQQATLSDLTQVNVSSSLIRWLIEQGRVKDAAICLNRPYTLQGPIVHGQHRGTALGFPTANLQTAQLLPAPGIYAGLAKLTDGRQFKAAISVGNNPTFHNTTTTVEAYLLDFSEDLYGKPLDLQFHRWLREMLPFDALPPLIKRIQQDVDETRNLIALNTTTEPAT